MSWATLARSFSCAEKHEVGSFHGVAAGPKTIRWTRCPPERSGHETTVTTVDLSVVGISCVIVLQACSESNDIDRISSRAIR